MRSDLQLVKLLTVDDSRWSKKMFTTEISKNKDTAKLEIVWRNSNAVRAPRRHNQEREGDCIRYILQEFLYDGELGYWTTIADLEVVPGGRAA